MAQTQAAARYTVSPDTLRDWMSTALQRQSVSQAHAALVAQALVQTSLWGIDTHGVARLPHYLRRLQTGSIRAQPALSIEHSGPATASVDGDHGLGIVVCDFAMEHATHLAASAGAGIVGCRHSSHCGALGLYGRQAAANGMIGIAMTHSDAMVAPYNGKQAFFGTNPLCIAVPCAGSEPVCVDIATSTIPFNRVMNARRDGEELPTGVAVDSGGNMTTCADDAVALLPFAGHKGYALAFLIDILCGPLNSMSFGPHLTPMYDELDKERNLGLLMIAIDPSRFAGGKTLAENVARMASEARAQPRNESDQPVLAPGDPEYETARQRARTGIPIENGLAREFECWSRELAITPPPTKELT